MVASIVVQFERRVGMSAMRFQVAMRVSLLNVVSVADEVKEKNIETSGWSRVSQQRQLPPPESNGEGTMGQTGQGKARKDT